MDADGSANLALDKEKALRQEEALLSARLFREMATPACLRKRPAPPLPSSSGSSFLQNSNSNNDNNWNVIKKPSFLVKDKPLMGPETKVLLERLKKIASFVPPQAINTALPPFLTLQDAVAKRSAAEVAKEPAPPTAPVVKKTSVLPSSSSSQLTPKSQMMLAPPWLQKFSTLDLTQMAVCHGFLEHLAGMDCRSISDREAQAVHMTICWLSEHLITAQMNRSQLGLRSLAMKHDKASGFNPCYASKAFLLNHLYSVLFQPTSIKCNGHFDDTANGYSNGTANGHTVNSK